MEKNYTHRILVINPGSTSTKTAVFDGEKCFREQNIEHSPDEMKGFSDIWDQFEFRKNAVMGFLEKNDIAGSTLSAVVGRGGLLKSIKGGTYEVNDAMLADARSNLQGVHISNTGCTLARAIADIHGIRAFTVDPVSVNEFCELAFYSGIKEIKRKSLSHTLSIHSVVRQTCAKLGWDVATKKFIVAHLGGGISVCPVEGGRIIDANNANSGGPFSPQRSGSLPVQELMEMCFSGKYSHKDMMKLTLKTGGLMSYLGTDNAREVEGRINSGDREAEKVYEAMAYQISKEIAAMAAVLSGKADLVILTGGLAKSDMLMNWIKARVSFIAEILVVPEVSEMEALATGALRILQGEEEAGIY